MADFQVADLAQVGLERHHAPAGREVAVSKAVAVGDVHVAGSALQSPQLLGPYLGEDEVRDVDVGFDRGKADVVEKADHGVDVVDERHRERF